jgi:predicted transglutaminase-like cysteine proteinase
LRFVVAAILAVFGTVASIGGATADSPWTTEVSRAFGVSDLERHNLGPFGKWQAALQRAQADEVRDAASCPKSASDPVCESRRQRAEFLEGLRGLSPLERLAAVHAYVNRVRWIDDQSNYGVSDYWATPDEFFVRGGDCEDYAFAKYDTLKQLGFAPEQMRIMVLNDLKLREPHAVLLVLVDGRLWALDNNLRNIFPVDAIRHYDPIYSINEMGWWLHRSTMHDVDSAGRRR